MNKIYTRTGDKGMTSLYTGKRVHKSDPFVQALGAVDEGNSAIGIALAFMPKEATLDQTKQQLNAIQHALFDVGAALATPQTSGSDNKLAQTRFGDEATNLLEQWIDEMEIQLPSLKTFILPGGHPAGAHLHLARSIIRRAERSVVPLYEQADVTNSVLIYLNRLSDYLFVVSRFVNHQLQVPEVNWQHHKLLT